jgi:HAE1 family hydrophobic/amphiphilic exporter-1
MQWLAKISVKRPVFATVLILFITVIGAVGYFQLGIDRFPKVDFPTVAVITRLPGAAPSEVETEITDKVEEAVNTISGIDELRSTSSEGVSQVFISFSLDKDIDVAAQEVRDHVGRVVPNLPNNIDAPVVSKLDPDATPVLYLSVNADKPIREVTEVADRQIRRQIENVPGVGQVLLLGGTKRQFNVWLDPIKLRAAEVSASDVQRAIGTQNLTSPGGHVDTGPEQLTLRIHGRAGSAAEMAALVVAQRDGHSIRVEDLGRVEDGKEEAETAAVRDGVPAVLLAIRKQSGSNTVAVVDHVQERVAEITGSLPEGYSLSVVRDNSGTIRTSIDAVKEHLVLGGLFAAAVVLLFLGNLRSTIIAAVAIPVSIVGTFALMWAQGFTLDTITLLALALAVGIVIDDAIVVLENIHRFIHEKGYKPFPAAILATKEIGLAVLATTLSLIAVFLPVAFMGGIVGRFLKSFGLTMAFAIAVSMLVSFALTPMMAARLLPPPPPPGQPYKKSFLERGIDKLYGPVERGYHRVLAFLLRRRWIVAVASVVVLLSVGVLGPKAGFGFLPENDEAQFEIYVRTKEGTSLDATTVLAERLARNTRKIPEVTHTLVNVADNDQKIQNVAMIYVRLNNPDQRARSQNEIMDDVRKHVLVDLPEGTRVAAQLVNDFSLGAQQNAMVMYLLSGPDLDRLTMYTNRIVEKMKTVPGVVDLDSSVPEPLPEQTLRPDLDRAAALGVDPADITSSLALMIGGLEGSTYEERGSQYSVFLRASERFRWDPSLLGIITVPSRTLGAVPLSDVVTAQEGTGPSVVNRTYRAKSVVITMNVAPGFSQGDVSAALEKAIADQKLPPGYHAIPWGQTREMGRTAAAFGFAFLMSFLFMYLVLAAQFESWLHPFTIMLTLPLTLPFALISIIGFGNHLDIFSMLGLLVLFGMVKKNGILQIDHANQLREKGMKRDEAILQAATDRLRPILMTTFAFVAGMLPLILTEGIGSGFSRAIAGVVVGGQTLSLALTLVAIPVFYSLFDSLASVLKTIAREVLRRGDTKVDRGEAEVGITAVEAGPIVS